jgi:hypothetical protein
MYFLLRNQEKIIKDAATKAGSERKLAKILKTVRASIYFYKHKNRPISEVVLHRLKEFLELNEIQTEQIILKKLDQNWKQKIGGQNCYSLKIKSGKFQRNLIKMKKASKLMHKRMKKELGKDYFLEQYRRFKMIGGYKLKTKRGELVRNDLEKRIADKLFVHQIDYQYEPCVNAGKSHYFPDFKVGNLVIECTKWRGFDKAPKLRKKIKDFKSAKYEVFVIVPSDLKKFYKSIEPYLIDESNIIDLIRPRLMPS